MVHGNDEGDPSFEIVLPDGSICSDHGIPDVAIAGFTQTRDHGLAEVDGVIYRCAGKDYITEAAVSKCDQVRKDAALLVFHLF